MKFIVINDNKGADHDKSIYFRVHKVGCADIPLENRKLSGNGPMEIEGNNVEDAIAKEVAEFAEQEMGYYRENYSIAPCIKGIKSVKTDPTKEAMATLDNFFSKIKI